MHTRGFTLIEFLVTLVVLAVLLAVAAPSYEASVLNGRISSISNDLVASVQVARGEALKRNQAVTLCASANGSTCAGSGGWEQGWVVRTTGGTVIQTHQALPSGMLLRTEGTSVLSLSLLPTGGSSQAVTFKLCRATPSVGSRKGEIMLYATGRASAQKLDGNTTCS